MTTQRRFTPRCETCGTPAFASHVIFAARSTRCAEGADDRYRILFATEGKKGCIRLGLHVIEKRTQKTPPREIELAERRLADWRRRARR